MNKEVTTMIRWQRWSDDNDENGDINACLANGWFKCFY